MPGARVNLPNLITIGRILACPVVFLLIMAPSAPLRFASFVVFLVAAFSDLWDGYLARKHGLITDFGKLLDPLADKFLLAATFIPFYILSRGSGPVGPIPGWGVLPLWVVVVIFGRELAVTAFRSWAAGRGVVISAGKSGKYKALSQNLFIGGVLLWYPLKMESLERGWSGGLWSFWTWLHGGWVTVTLALAILLTVYSMLDYFWSYRKLVGVGR
jgi:CDP-diacylglycerol---glycerol-3-phosphate 3-phosphatidyltransferase